MIKVLEPALVFPEHTAFSSLCMCSMSAETIVELSTSMIPGIDQVGQFVFH